MKKFRRRPTFPHSYPCSIIGAAGLNFCVRDGNRCDPCAIATENRKLVFNCLRRLYDAFCFVSKRFLARFFRSLLYGKVGERRSSPQPSRKLFMVKPHGQLVPVSYNTLLCLHTRPINVVVSDGPLGDLHPREISS